MHWYGIPAVQPCIDEGRVWLLNGWHGSALLKEAVMLLLYCHSLSRQMLLVLSTNIW